MLTFAPQSTKVVIPPLVFGSMVERAGVFKPSFKPRRKMLPTISAPVLPAHKRPMASPCPFNASSATAMEVWSRPLKILMAGSSFRIISVAVRISNRFRGMVVAAIFPSIISGSVPAKIN